MQGQWPVLSDVSTLEPNMIYRYDGPVRRARSPLSPTQAFREIRRAWIKELLLDSTQGVRLGAAGNPEVSWGRS